ncbi:hypothetical protein BDR07DRAFT_1090458 [Suillus spraguei]|nr:hypothetical protein BDR07DRAFT_1090458 [Suillus spraguei]
MSCPAWSVNDSGQSPCDIVAQVYNACSSTTYGAISPSSFEDSFIPVGANATLCTCSWASYNLLSACMCCVTGLPSFVSWDAWIKNCVALTSTTTYFPWDSGKRLPSNTTMPYYASYYPGNYTNQTFDENFVSDIGAGSKPDLNGSPLSSTSSSSSSSSSSSVGPIVGGIIGGIVLLLLLCGFFFFIICRKRRRAAQFPHIWNGSHLAVATKDSTTRGPLAPSGYPQTSAAMSTSAYTIQPNHIRNAPSAASLHSLHIASPTSAGHTTSLASPNAPVLIPVSDVADVITPFLATRPSTRPGTPNKKSATRSHDQPAHEPAASRHSPRSRMNPPPYTPSSPTSSTHSRTGSNTSRRLDVMRHFRRASGSGDATIASVMDQKKTHAPKMHSVTSVESSVSGASDNGRNIRTTLERTTTTAASSSRRPAV